MASDVEHSHAASGDVTLHTWTDVEGRKKENYYITGTPGTLVPAWFRQVLLRKHLGDLAHFPASPTGGSA
jgi:hypothetical protein